MPKANFAKNVSNRIFYMDEGVIYEDGTPQQVFDNPIKEKTRRFIRQLKVLSEVIDKTDPLGDEKYLTVITLKGVTSSISHKYDGNGNVLVVTI